LLAQLRKNITFLQKVVGCLPIIVGVPRSLSEIQKGLSGTPKFWSKLTNPIKEVRFEKGMG
jgi:hypothetical protein